MLRRLIDLCLCLSLFLLAGCEEEDIVSLRIRVAADLSGSLTTSGLALPATAGAVESAGNGIAWIDRANVITASGSFKDLSEVQVGEIRFHYQHDGELNVLEVNLPRGEDVAWVRAFVPAVLDDPARRSSMSRSLDPEGQAKRLGTTVKLVLELPADIVASGINPRARRLKQETDHGHAELIVPVEVALGEGPPIRWHLTWEGE